jgi:hypothetical protein
MKKDIPLPTPHNMPIGISDFKKLRENALWFADKSLFIKEIMENSSEVLIITRPRRFGKTINMSMLECFLKKGAEDFFEGLNIKNHPEFCTKHQNKYPVLFISFKDIGGETFEEAFTKIKIEFSKLYKSHLYLLEGKFSTVAEKETFLKICDKSIEDPGDFGQPLADILKHMRDFHNCPVILLIDEYDTPIHKSYNKPYFAQMMSFMRDIMSPALKDNSNLKKAVITGITRIAKESFFSGLNNVRTYSLLNKAYADSFGFTSDEVESFWPQDIPLEDVQRWYNGYNIGKFQIYNPWSIINCIANEGELVPYWVNTASNEFIHAFLQDAHLVIEEDLEKLLAGQAVEQILDDHLVFQDLKTSSSALWTLFVHAGYLTPEQIKLDSRGRFNVNLKIPNNEVVGVYESFVEKYFYAKRGDVRDYQDFINSLKDGNVDLFASKIRGYIAASSSYFDFSKNTPEKIFHTFMLGILVGFHENYIVKSNIEAGLGRCDIIMIPRTPGDKGFVLEFKTAQSQDQLGEKAKEALGQIKEKRYTDGLSGISEVLCIGLAFCGKSVDVAWEKI